MSNPTAVPKIAADKVVHELDGLDYHRIIVNGVPGEWFPPNEIAFGGVYYAALRQQGAVTFPQVFSVTEESFDILAATEDHGGDPE